MSILQNLFRTSPKTDLKNIIEQGAFLVDVRTPSEFASGHIKGSVNIPLDKIPSQLSLLKGKKQIVVFCQSGARSSQAKSILERNGITGVTNAGSWKQVNQYVK